MMGIVTECMKGDSDGHFSGYEANGSVTVGSEAVAKLAAVSSIIVYSNGSYSY